jgi:hypothetical protein
MKTQQATATKSRKTINRKAASNDAGENIRQMIAEAAYFHAEHRGFQGGSMDDDWFLAEAEIEAMLSEEQPH